VTDKLLTNCDSSDEAILRVPVIDIRPWLTLEATSPQCLDLCEQVRRACHEIGFFYVVNHDIAPSLVRDYVATVHAFFALPDAVKRRLDKSGSPHFRGWERLGSELTNNEVDYREQLDIGAEREVEPNPTPYYRALIGPNQWPSEDELPRFRATVETFLGAAQTLSNQLLGLMSASLGLDVDHIQNVFGNDPQPYCKLIRYPPTPAGSRGVGAHKDSGFLTLLLQDEVGGLSAETPTGQWLDIAPIPDSLVVNIGELLQIMTHNYFIAAPHRVTNANAQTVRYSSAYFYSPDLDTPLDPLPIAQSLRDAVHKSPAHREAKVMASRAELVEGAGGMSATLGAARFGDKYWQRWVRSYPDIAQKFYPHHST
jgi:isopenicillin N synthase-like dioxygenase